MNEFDRLIYELHAADELGTEISAIIPIHTFSNGSVAVKYTLNLYGNDDRTGYFRLFVPTKNGNSFDSTEIYSSYKFNVGENPSRIIKELDDASQSFIESVQASIKDEKSDTDPEL